MNAMITLDVLEGVTLWTAIVGYTVACIVAVFGTVLKKSLERTQLLLLSTASILHTVALGTRWIRLDHVPVGTVFEMLSANIWGLGMALALGYWLLPRVRAATVFALPIIVLLMGWMLMVPATDSVLPATYKTVWLFIHIGFIKLFLGCAFIALAVSGVILTRQLAWGGARFARLPDDASLIELGFRFLAMGWIFDSLGIIAGAIWAQDAWGRYWSWDQLEVWSLITWLTIGFAVHFRTAYKISPIAGAWMVVVVWLVAFFTFFGVPFVSPSLHKGAI